MKKILFIAPHSFPIRSSESICNAKVAYSLSQQGYHVDVFACSGLSTYPEDQVLDRFLRNSPNLRVFNVDTNYVILKSLPIAKLIRSILYNIKILLKTGYFYNGISIPYLIWEQIKQVNKSGFDYDIVLTRGYLTDLAAVLIVDEYGIPWLANWNDPFPRSKFPPPYGKGCKTPLPFFENRIYKAIQRKATCHSFPNIRLRNYMLQCFADVKEQQTVVIPHMALSTINPKGNKNNKVLRMVHCGNVKKPRDPKPFLEALSSISNIIQEKGITIECHFIGVVDNDIESFVKSHSLASIVHLHGSMTYKESTDFISSCTISLVIEADCEEGIYLPTKVVDSFQCGIPIFCVSPKTGVLHDIVEKYPVGYYSLNTSLDSIREALMRLLIDFQENNIPYVNKNTVPSFFEDAIVKQYSLIIG